MRFHRTNRVHRSLSYALVASFGLALGGAGCSCDDTNPPLGRLQPELATETDTLDFGEVPLGALKELPLKVENKGQLGLLLCASAPPEGQAPDPICTVLNHFEPEGAPFATQYENLTEKGTWAVDPLASRELIVSFSPTVEGAIEARLILVHNGKNGPTTAITVRGIGVRPQIDVDQTVLDFGEVTVGQRKGLDLTLTNRTQFAQPVSFAPIDQVSMIFGVGSDARPGEAVTVIVPGNSSLPVNVWFAPIEEGQAQATLKVNYCPDCSVDVMLLGQGVKPAFELDPAQLDFGVVNEGQTQARTFIVRNIGLSSLTVQSIDLEAGTTPEYAVDAAVQAGLPRQLLPAEELTVTVTYAAATPGVDPGRVVVATNAWDNPVTGESESVGYVNLTATTNGPDINVLPLQVNFGTVAILGSATQNVLIENTGTSPLTVSGVALNSPTPDLAISAAVATPQQIAPGASITVALRYNPQEAGPDQGQLVIQSDDRDENPVVVSVAGFGGVPTTCAITPMPAQLTFGLVERGRQVSLPVEIKNTGAQPCSVTNLRLMGDPVFTTPSAGMSFTVAPGSSQRVTVTYAPTAYAMHSAQLLFDADDPARPNVTVPISGASGPSEVRVIPGSVDFAVVPVTCGSPNRPITIYNTGTRAVTVTRIYLDPSSSAEFELCVTGAPTSGRCNSTLPVPTAIPAGGSVTFNVRYRPTDIGVDTGVLFIEHSASVVPFAVPLSGDGEVTPRVTDRFTQLPTPAADVLFVVDNSCSMDAEQASLGSNLGAFLTYARSQAIDYQIAVTTTDRYTEQGRFVGNPRIITPATPNQDAIFRQMVTLGTFGASDEAGLEAAYLALTDPNLSGTNAGFLRQDAALAIIVVSDEEDSSPRNVPFYQNFFLSIKGASNSAQFSFSAVITPPGNCPTGATEGNRYISVAQATGGVIESICTANWGTTLANIGLATFGLRRRFALSSQPVPSTIAVSVNGVADPSVTPTGQVHWRYDGPSNSVVFEQTAVPPSNATIEITYTVACLP